VERGDAATHIERADLIRGGAGSPAPEALTVIAPRQHARIFTGSQVKYNLNVEIGDRRTAKN
jgi:hypothetical protein